MSDPHHGGPADDVVGKVYDTRLMRRLVTYLRPHRIAVAIAFVTILLSSLVELAQPWMTQQAIDRYIAAGDMAGLMRLVGIVLLVAAVLFWVAAPAVLLTPLSTAQKAWTGSAFLILGEVAFWVAAVVLGREVFRRYRRYLDPRGWLGKKRL